MSVLKKGNRGILGKMAIVVFLVFLHWIITNFVGNINADSLVRLPFFRDTKKTVYEAPWNVSHENLHYGYYLPSLSNLFSQDLIKKHNTLVSDIQKLYDDIKIIQTKGHTCGIRPAFCNPACWGIGVSLIFGSILIADNLRFIYICVHFQCIYMWFIVDLRDGRPVITQETCGDHWAKWDKSKSCETWFDCYLPKFEYKPSNETSGKACNLTTQWFADKYGHFMYYSSIFNYVYNGDIIRDNKVFEISKDDCMVVHVRRGDACYIKHRRCYNYTQYLDGAIMMRKLYGINNVEFITDAHDLNIGVQLFAKNGFNIRYNKNIHNRTAFDNPAVSESHKQDYGTLPIKEYFDDLNSGSKCKALVGTFTSSVSKIIFTLMLFYHQYYPPFYSLGGCADLSVYIDGAMFNCPHRTNISSKLLHFT